MKNKLTALICAAVMMFPAALPVLAESESTASASGEKAVTAPDNTNPNTGVVTLASVSVALAGCVVVVFKKRK